MKIPALTTKQKNYWMVAVSLMLAFVAVAQIAGTYHVFSHTWDEPAHIAAGMQLLDRGIYTYEVQHPPLARLATAIIPYLTGSHSSNDPNIWTEGLRLLYSGQCYELNLTRARLGILPFFVLLVALTWYWGNQVSGMLTATVATFFLVTQPTILAHAALATTDLPMVAMSVWSLFCFVLWLEKPTSLHSIILGISTGLAFMAKFSSIPFLAVSFLVVILYRWLLESSSWNPVKLVTPTYLRQILFCLVFLFISAWAVYGFSWSHYPQSPEAMVAGEPSSTSLPTVITATMGGVKQVLEHNTKGHSSYLLGEWRQHGWWYYFPVAIIVKATIPLLICVVTGLAVALRNGWVEKDWKLAVPGIMALSILAYSMTANINIGVRHILLMFPLLAIQAAYGVQWMLNLGKRFWITHVGIAILLLWQSTATLAAHPDYLAWFNELAGSHPERILISGDLDWGQDLKRLSSELKARNIKHLAIAYNGFARMDRHNLPANVKLVPGKPVTGWVAISLRIREAYEGYRWLKKLQPVTRVGKSIDLYFIEPSDLSESDRIQARMREALFVRYNLHETEQALALFKEILSIHPHHYGALWQSASALQDLGRLDLAESAWKEVMSEAQRTRYTVGEIEAQSKLNSLRQKKP